MSKLVRKISRAKWEVLEPKDSIDADAITSCLRTQKNCLSVWRSTMDDAVVAIVSNADRLATMHLVSIDESFLVEQGIAFVDSPGNSPLEDMNGKHVDLSNLNYAGLGQLAEYVAAQIGGNEVTSYTAVQIAKLFVAAQEQDRLKIGDLKEELWKDIQKRAATSK